MSNLRRCSGITWSTSKHPRALRKHSTYSATHPYRGHDAAGYAPTSSPGVTDAVDPYQILYLRSLGIPHVVLRLK